MRGFELCKKMKTTNGQMVEEDEKSHIVTKVLELIRAVKTKFFF